MSQEKSNDLSNSSVENKILHSSNIDKLNKEFTKTNTCQVFFFTKCTLPVMFVIIRINFCEGQFH